MARAAHKLDRKEVRQEGDLLLWRFTAELNGRPVTAWARSLPGGLVVDLQAEHDSGHYTAGTTGDADHDDAIREHVARFDTGRFAYRTVGQAVRGRR